MTYLWFVTHFIRKNYYILQEKYNGKSIIFQCKDYDDLKNLNMNDGNDITGIIHPAQEGLFERTQNAYPYRGTRIYFPLESEYKDLLQKYRQKTKNLTFDRKNIHEFNLEIYFEENIEIFPDLEIEEAIIERIEEYIDKMIV